MRSILGIRSRFPGQNLCIPLRTQAKGYLEMKVSGKSKLYSPTEAGKKYIPQQLNEFKFVFQQILGDGSAAPDKDV